MSRLIRTGVVASAFVVSGSIAASAQVPPAPACPEGQACGDPKDQHASCYDQECNDCRGAPACLALRKVKNEVLVNTEYPPYCCATLQQTICYVSYLCSTAGLNCLSNPPECGTAYNPTPANGPTKWAWVKGTGSCSGHTCAV